MTGTPNEPAWCRTHVDEWRTSAKTWCATLCRGFSALLLATGESDADACRYRAAVRRPARLEGRISMHLCSQPPRRRTARNYTALMFMQGGRPNAMPPRACMRADNVHQRSAPGMHALPAPRRSTAWFCRHAGSSVCSGFIHCARHCPALFNEVAQGGSTAKILATKNTAPKEV
ncbi:hypothetical protein MRX96_047048 [Rhipicephalus microplus]